MWLIQCLSSLLINFPEEINSDNKKKTNYTMMLKINKPCDHIRKDTSPLNTTHVANKQSYISVDIKLYKLPKPITVA